MLSRIRKSMADKDQGFTLIEFLVVIIIIGIQAAIAIPVFLNQRKKGVDASLKADLKNTAIVVDTVIVDHPTTQGVVVGNSVGSLTVDSTPPPWLRIFRLATMSMWPSTASAAVTA